MKYLILDQFEYTDFIAIVIFMFQGHLDVSDKMAIKMFFIIIYIKGLFWCNTSFGNNLNILVSLQ